MEQTADLRLRKAQAEDCRFLYELRNEESVRKNSFHTEEIAYEQHEQWFAKKIQHPMVRMYILTLADERIGQVRVDIEDEKAEISYALCKEARGHGYAKWMLREAERILKEEAACHSLVAEVLRGNVASRKIFEALGYEEAETAFGYFYRKDIS